MSEKIRKISAKGKKIIKTKSDMNTVDETDLQNETSLAKCCKKKNIKDKEQLLFSTNKSKVKRKLLLDKKLNKDDPDRKKMTLIKKHSPKKTPIKETKHQLSDTLLSLPLIDDPDKNSDIPDINIRQMEIDSLNNLIANVNQEQQNEDITYIPTSLQNINLPSSHQQTTSDQADHVKNVKVKQKSKKKMKIDNSAAQEIDKIIENLSSYKIPVESNCQHIFSSSDEQLRSGDEMESIVFVCVLCGESKDYYR